MKGSMLRKITLMMLIVFIGCLNIKVQSIYTQETIRSEV